MSLRLFGAPAIRVNLPPELADEGALLAYLNLSPAELKKIWWFRARMYQTFPLGTGPGKVRIIDAPNARLKHLQRKIAPLLDGLYRVRHPVHGFVAGKSVKTNAEAHLRKRFVVNLDLKDFFPSISEKRVKGLLVALGMASRVAAIVARICTNAGHLPQGAPTSPVLSNMICFRLDKDLMAFARDCRCTYTRYADDITFSSHQPMTTLFEGAIPPPGRFSPELLQPTLRSVFERNGFAINVDKAHYADRNSRRIVTGLKVNELVNVDRRFVRNLRAALFSVHMLGPEKAQDKFETKFGSKKELAAHLSGKISWLRFIRGQSDPVFREMALRFNAVYPDRLIEVLPTPEEVRDRSTWIVETENDMGTAFFLKGVGLVTAAHCVKDVKEVEIYHASKFSNRFKVTVEKLDHSVDLAVLGHTVPSTEYYELERAAAAAVVGDATIAIGFPSFGYGDVLNVREGKVSSLAVQHGMHLIEVDQKLAQGMSGGPLLNEAGQVIGVIHKGGPSEPRDFAVRIDQIDKL